MKARENRNAAFVAEVPYRLGTKFREETIVPSEAFERRYWDDVSASGRNGVTVMDILASNGFTTADGKFVRIRFIGTFNGLCEEDLDFHCRRLFGMGFRSVRSVWESRFLKMEGYWHHIAMEEIDGNDRVKGLSAGGGR